MARPTAPLVLNTGNTVGGSVDRCWLVTADADIADLKATGPTLSRVSSPAYTDDSYVGPSFGGTGYCQSTESSDILTSTGYRTGAIFSRASSKGASSGIETLFCLARGDVLISAGEWYYALVIDDGTIGLTGSAAGKICAVWRTDQYGSFAGRVGPVLSANTAYFITHRLSQWSDVLAINDVEYSGGGLAGGTAPNGGGNYVNIGCRDGYNYTADWIIAADTHVACAWLDFNGSAEVSDVQAKAWSADGWAMFTGGGGSMSKSNRQLLMGVG